MRAEVFWPEGHGELAVIAKNTQFSKDDIVFYSGASSLDEALNQADLLLCGPHAGSAMPEEISSYIVPKFTRRFQFDYTDMTTAPIARRWAEIDPHVIYVENPHPRIVRDPNRPKPTDLEGDLREAFRRVNEAGQGHAVDLSGIDAIRPVTFGFRPVLKEPQSDAEWKKLIADFTQTAKLGVDVYEAHRDELFDEMIKRALARGSGAHVSLLSFHDTMNAKANEEGAISIMRDEKDRLPDIVALSNRGDDAGEMRGDEAVSMKPSRIRALAEAHHKGFEAKRDDDVCLNKPYYGSLEVMSARAKILANLEEAEAKGVALDAVQAEFLREYLLGDNATAHLQKAGKDWPAFDPQRIEQMAQSCKKSWDLYRASMG